MPNPNEERFVQFLFPCQCGVELQVHGEYFLGPRVGGPDSVACPKCGKEQILPTRPLRFFYRDENSWKVVFTDKIREEARGV
jgi:hypothetical protein